MEGFLTNEEIEDIKELFEKVHNNKSLSSVEEDYLIDKDLKIINNGNSVDLISDKNEKVLVTIDYFTVDYNTREWWAKKWDIVDKDFNKLLIK